MNVLTKKMRSIIVLPLLGVLLTISLLLFASYILQRPSFQKLVIERISDATGYDINTSEIDLSLWRGIGISVYGLEARSREGFEKVIASKVNISLNAGQLLRGRIVPARIYLYKPKIELDIPEELGALREGASPFILNPLHFWIPGIKSIIVDQGYFGMKDMPFSLHDLNLDAHPKSPGATTLRLKSAGKIVGKGKSVSFGLEGTLSQKKDEPRIPYAEMALQFDKVPMTWIPWPEAMPFDGFFGARLNVNASG